ncbi:hypothetical protein METBIDRAFT_41139 [Metschnikowia bicuspidata var. bicuspidata NRRL YB-4993]|uniref:Uncharacterized protein n=1 Tax=Metschnikowia bicuspidata var. bicuspidata NRRL YB-4993 TaxID=869754 RepID=A0A1A0HAK0_9ASCO|nr:hypothetical protein METBIDRAFT_41139 [Metschnikowia bicuspidata var. bicuspidata NRRL YB-4993]OBA20902.1 hypothetical protein METBIDRAFT_41139 [Metschnikowia bicuspidata var. bicuspidata NRRL YB-4993]
MITSTSDGSARSVLTVDRLPIARASVAALDKLWTQIDVLDDVKAMAEEVDRTGGFFTDDFSISLAQLKSSQSRLLEVISRHQALSDRAREQRRQLAKEHSELVSVDEEDILQQQERTRKRMSDFFSATAAPLVETAQSRDFDELNEYALEVRDSLGEVSEKMRDFDLVTKKLW